LENKIEIKGNVTLKQEKLHGLVCVREYEDNENIYKIKETRDGYFSDGEVVNLETKVEIETKKKGRNISKKARRELKKNVVKKEKIVDYLYENDIELMRIKKLIKRENDILYRSELNEFYQSELNRKIEKIIKKRNSC